MSSLLRSLRLLLLCLALQKSNADRTYDVFGGASAGKVVHRLRKALQIRADRIGLATAQTYRDLTGNEPRVAYLSFSTKGSAGGPLVEKVQKAVELAKPRFAEAGIKMDGEMQFDAAIVPAVGQLKNPNGEIQGNANVFIFPDLQAGNIGYKIAQRIGGADAIGPNLQGLAKAMNDLSRGCSAEDIVGTICVTLLQSQTK